ncbi:hypothetical protein IFR05_005380 [Cadophora sp. M221]|nr:hypothetical protein IFR05_005380 [Cadophora sp. M221]
MSLITIPDKDAAEALFLMSHLPDFTEKLFIQLGDPLDTFTCFPKESHVSFSGSPRHTHWNGIERNVPLCFNVHLDIPFITGDSLHVTVSKKWFEYLETNHPHLIGSIKKLEIYEWLDHGLWVFNGTRWDFTGYIGHFGQIMLFGGLENLACFRSAISKFERRHPRPLRLGDQLEGELKDFIDKYKDNFGERTIKYTFENPRKRHAHAH